jgi:hypothetical protein
MNLELSGSMLLAACLAGAPGLASAEAPPVPQVWRLEYSLTGGRGGLNRHLGLTQAGDLTVENYPRSASQETRIDRHASSDLMARTTRFLESARAAPRDPAHPAIPDALDRSMTLASGVAKRELQVPDDIALLFLDTMDSVTRGAFVGAWRQSGWKLCTPVTQLTAGDLDMPIDRLVFDENGGWSVTWKDSGAHTGLPPMFSGQYRIDPAYSYIQVSIGSGATPRDFSGSGHFRFRANTVVLQNIWFGTRQAKRKPDVCELTFTRTSDATAHE